VRYAEAVHNAVAASTGSRVGETFAAVVAELGEDAAIEAAMTCAAFNGLVRVADGIGIELDEGTEANTRTARATLGLDNFGGAENTNAGSGADVAAETVAAMFSADA
jgi:hypothetical protein